MFHIKSNYKEYKIGTKKFNQELFLESETDCEEIYDLKISNALEDNCDLLFICIGGLKFLPQKYQKTKSEEEKNQIQNTIKFCRYVVNLM